jgi:hypothetical protein
MNANERHEVFDFINRPNWEPIGEELAKNSIEYRHILESNTLNASQGTHILIINEKLVRYGNYLRGRRRIG